MTDDERNVRVMPERAHSYAVNNPKWHAHAHREWVVRVRSPAHWTKGWRVYASVMEAEALRPATRWFALDGGADVETDDASDEQLALRAREQYRESGIPDIPAEEHVLAHLELGERLLASRDAAIVRRIDVEADGRVVISEEGPLYVTDRRLIHLGTHIELIPLTDIDELSMADDRILVTLSGSRGVTLDVDSPHQLRVLIAAAKAARRVQVEG